jgi:F-type H+-transporting ATPase subunit b
MLIDWFTVGAQALNFLILVWLLKRFLYKPVLDAIDAREQRVAAELADADAIRATACAERDEYRKKNEVFDRQRAELLAQASADARAQREQLLDDARAAARALADTRRERLQSDEKALHLAIGVRAQQEVFAIARKALSDLADAGLEERMVAVFIARLQALTADELTTLASTLTTSGETVRVRSAYELPPAPRAACEQAIAGLLGADIEVAFDTVPELVGGIEMLAGGQKVAWSIAGYLRTLENGVGELLREKAGADATPAHGGDDGQQ